VTLMQWKKVITAGLIFLLVSLSVSQLQAYDKKETHKINSTLTCQCGCNLLVSVCRMEGCMCEGVRKQVGEMLDEGKTPTQIRQTMVAEYGEKILAAPPKEGFNLSAYVLPFVFLIIGGYVLLLIITRWLPRFRSANDAPITPGTSGDNENETSDDVRHLQQIEKELKDLDL